MMDFTIEKVRARQIFDSRATPAVEVEVTLRNGVMGRAIVPSGASTGAFEALELRDKDNLEYFGGKGVKTAIHNIETELAELLVGQQANRQYELDRMMIALDGTPNKSRLGANAILGCSMAIAYASANNMGIPLYRYLGGSMAKSIPVPMIQIIGGGAHAANSIDIQDYLVIPMNAPSFEAGLAMVVHIYNATKKVFEREGKPLSVADEGGFWPTDFKTNEDGLRYLMEGIKLAGYKPGIDVGIALDIAASEFYEKETGTYCLALENKRLSTREFVDLLVDWVDKYAIVSIEDGCSEYDWEGCQLLTKKLGNRIQLIGDDIFTTNVERISAGVKMGICNSVLIKLNQIGSISETIDAIEMTKCAGYNPVISARSGETEDVTIVHLAIATNAGQLKVGSVARSERTCKWNEVIRIEQDMGSNGAYPSNALPIFVRE